MALTDLIKRPMRRREIKKLFCEKVGIGDRNVDRIATETYSYLLSRLAADGYLARAACDAKSAENWYKETLFSLAAQATKPVPSRRSI